MNAPHDHIHQLGLNPIANQRALRLWRSARKIFGKRAGFSVTPVKLESGTGLLGTVGRRQSVFTVVGQHPQIWAGCLEVRVSELTGRITVAPLLMTAPVVYPQIAVKSALSTKAAAKQLRRFAQDFASAIPA